MKQFAGKILKISALIVTGLVLGLLLLEVGARIMGYRPVTYLRKFSQHDPLLGWVKTPDSEGYFQRGRLSIHEKLNSKGLRSPEYGYAKPENTKRILVLGDSFTEGYDVQIGDLFTTILEKQLQTATGQTVEVINGGTGGYSPDQEYLFFRTEGFKYQPDAVVLMTYAANDIYYTLKDRYGNFFKPRYEHLTKQWSVVNEPVPPPSNVDGFKTIFRQMALYQLVLDVVLPALPSVTKFLGSTGLISREAAEIATTDGGAPASFDVFRRNQSPDIEKAWDITKALISGAKSLTDSLGGVFVVFTVPDRFQVYDEDWEITQKRYNVNDTLWTRTAPEEILDKFCRENGVSYINFLDSLQHRKPLPILYNGVHWNEEGNRVAAEVIYHHLLSLWPADRDN